jgi:hypothetical protein
MFLHQLAVSPREVVDVIRDGAVVFGASSMGALRGAECWPAGMRALGVIARLFRWGCLDSDDEVAVATNPEKDYAATSVALINVRYAVSRAVRQKLIDRNVANAIVSTTKAIYFSERHWHRILYRAGVVDDDGSLEVFLTSFDLKKRDALQAAAIVAQHLRGLNQHTIVTQACGISARPERYPGHHRSFGFSLSEAAGLLAQWLLGSGLYQPYIWALAAAEPELAILAGKSPNGLTPETRREALAEILARYVSDFDAFASALWNELEFLDELDAELMRWHAVRTLASTAPEPTAEMLERVRNEIAIAHGVIDWEMLQEETVEGKLYGAIPLAWVQTACSQAARARFWKSH